MSDLHTLAQKSGALSVGLDSVATWCFASGGTWTAGHRPPAGKQQVVLPPGALPQGDCERAVKSCKAAKDDIPAQMVDLLHEALADLNRPYLGAVYTAKRSGLDNRPTDQADCNSQVRGELFMQAQARMDLARLASQVQNEYAGYRKWLLTEGLRCAQLVRAGKKDLLRKGISIDGPVAAGGATQQPAPPAAATVTLDRPAGVVLPGPGAAAAAPPASPTPVPPTPMALTVPFIAPAFPGGGEPLAVTPPVAQPDSAAVKVALEKWHQLNRQRSVIEQDKDWTAGFLASRELRDCRCQQVAPHKMVQGLQTDGGVAMLAHDHDHSKCEQCLQDAYGSWRTRADKQCKLMDELSDYELGVLQRSDDGNGLPQRCFEAVRTKRGGAVAARPGGAAAPSGPRPGPSPMTTLPGSTVATAPGGPLPNPGQRNDVVTARQDAPPNWTTVTTPVAETFARSQDYAPVPMREDGRLYVRVFMSSGCAADVLPGPMQARTGDLLLLPPNPPSVSVRMPCGGLVEVYWGREVKPRVSEIIGRNQPLTLQFRRQ